jgi:hypothetical protein
MCLLFSFPFFREMLRGGLADVWHRNIEVKKHDNDVTAKPCDGSFTGKRRSHADFKLRPARVPAVYEVLREQIINNL